MLKKLTVLSYTLLIFSRKILSFTILMLLFTATSAQDKSPVKFGKVSSEDFNLSKFKFDTSANAVVISDIGSSVFETNSKGWFSIVFKHQKRMKILNKNGFEASNIDIPLVSNGSDEENLMNLKACTYNLENGNVIKTELQGNTVFKEKLSKNVIKRKFTFPAVKEGSIIEYSYTIKSDFLFNLQPWTFQGEYPRIWSEYEVGLPDFFNYVTLGQGYQPYFLQNTSQKMEIFNITIDGGAEANNHVSLSSYVTSFKWVMKDVPPLKEEPFTSTINNHIAKIEFQLSQYRFPNEPVKDIMGNWNTVSEKLLEREDFGNALNKNNNWLDGDIKTIVAGTTGNLEKTKHIYTYVRDNFTCTDHSDVFINNPLKTVFKNKNGSVSDINMLLIAMLRHENIEVDPVILSTRDHGITHQIYPLMDRYNYVIAKAIIGNDIFYLDATHPSLAFGKLPLDCYNGYARVIGKMPELLNFDANSVIEKKVTTVFIINNDKGESEGSFKSDPGYYESYDIRRQIKEKGEDDFFKKIKSSYGSDAEIKEPHIDSLKNNESALSVRYDFKLGSLDQDIIYFNPMMSEAYKHNLFKSAERIYPVEMPYTFDETFILNMETPKNYTLDEIPKSAKVSFNEGDGYFEYLFSKTESGVQMRSRVVMKKANFAAEDYNSLREFFGYIVKKQSEQIVFKKKK